MEVLQNGIPEPVDFTPCSNCGRTFNPEVLSRHERVCAKNQQITKKRPVFDTAKKRMEGTDLQAFHASRPHLKTRKPSTAEIKSSEKKKNWRRKHEDFLQSIRSARDYTEAQNAGTSLSPPQPSQPNPDYVQCPHCERRFEQYSAERHIPFCKEKHSRIERKAQGNKAMEKLNKRTQYKPPSLKKKSSANQQDSSSKPPHANPHGYHLVTRNTNFSGTYTLDENSPEKPSYHSSNRVGKNASCHGPTVRTTVPKAFSHRKMTSGTSATPARELPGSISEPGVRKRSSDMGGSGASSFAFETRRQSSHLKTPQPVTSRHARNQFSNERGGGGRVGLVRQVRGDANNDGRQFSSSSSLGDGEPPRLAPVKPKGKSRRALRVREDSPLSHDDLPRNDVHFGSGGESAHHVGSGSSLNICRGVPLNQHGMKMGKFCYECGAKYPVPQAKYCCECGTKRI